jgi:hypothetical protein
MQHTIFLPAMPIVYNLTACQQNVFTTTFLQACQQIVTIVPFSQLQQRCYSDCWQVAELQEDNKLLKQFVTSLLTSTTL